MSLTKLKEFCIPEDGNAVVELLGKYQDGALIVAGGTFVHGLIARGLLTEVEALIDIHKLGLDYVKSDSNELRLGATTTFGQLLAAPEVQELPVLGAVKDALEYPPAQIKNIATIGGCIAASCPYFDVPISFLALDCIVKAQGPGGSREIRLEDFFSSLFENTLNADEFMTELIVPVSSSKSASAFIKLETNANDLAILNTAVSITMGDSGDCDDVRIFVGGGVGETPVRAITAENEIKGQTLNEDLITKAGQAALTDVDPMTDHRASSEYRTAMTKVLVERSLRQALSRLN